MNRIRKDARYLIRNVAGDPTMEHAVFCARMALAASSIEDARRWLTRAQNIVEEGTRL